MDILIYALIFLGGFLIGFIIKSIFSNRLRDSASGTIVVNRDKLSEKTVYSLVLDDYPEKLELKKVVIFNVDASDLDSERE